MATDLRTPLAYLGSNGDFQAWVDALHAQFVAAGLVQTTDTGQLATPCVASRPGTSSYAGYEIWRFNDGAYQTACPIFLKVEYGCGSVNDRPLLRWSFGTGSNGSGTLTGQTTSTVTSTPNGSKTAAATLPSYCSGGDGWFHLVTHLDVSSASFACTVLIERPRNGDGSIATTGFHVIVRSASGSTGRLLVPTSGSVPSFDSGTSKMGFPPMVGGAQTNLGADIALWPATIVTGGRSYWSLVLAYRHADIGELGTITASHLGASHTFMPMGDGGNSLVGDAAEAFAICWE